MRAVPDELDTYRGVVAPTRKAVADPTEKEDGPIEIPKASSTLVLNGLAGASMSHSSLYLLQKADCATEKPNSET